MAPGDRALIINTNRFGFSKLYYRCVIFKLMKGGTGKCKGLILMSEWYNINPGISDNNRDHLKGMNSQ